MRTFTNTPTNNPTTATDAAKLANATRRGIAKLETHALRVDLTPAQRDDVAYSLNLLHEYAEHYDALVMTLPIS